MELLLSPLCCIFVIICWMIVGMSAFFDSKQKCTRAFWVRTGVERDRFVCLCSFLVRINIMNFAALFKCVSLRVCIPIRFCSHGTATVCPIFWSMAFNLMRAACHIERLSGWFVTRAYGDGVGVMKWVWMWFAAGGPSPSHHTAASLLW